MICSPVLLAINPKTKLMKKTIVLLFLAQFAIAQETASPPGQSKAHRYFGIGYKLGMFQTSELNNFMPVNRLLLSIDPIKFFRIDVQWGISNGTQQTLVQTSSGANTTYNLDSKNSVMQFGAFGVYPADDMLLFFGLRYGITKGMNEYLNSSFGPSGPVYTTEERSLDSKIISPVIGGEYRFGNRFAVGAELGFLMVKQTSNDGNAGSPDLEGKQTLLETCAFFRFFPF